MPPDILDKGQVMTDLTAQQLVLDINGFLMQQIKKERYQVWRRIHLCTGVIVDKIIIINGILLAFSSRLEVNSVGEKTFHNTGLYYFHLESSGVDWADDDIISSFCLVKVTQTDRY